MNHSDILSFEEIMDVVDAALILVVDKVRITGVEMEALTALSASLINVYDMCKVVDKNMKISNIKLIGKTKRTFNSTY